MRYCQCDTGKLLPYWQQHCMHCERLAAARRIHKPRRRDAMFKIFLVLLGFAVAGLVLGMAEAISDILETFM